MKQVTTEQLKEDLQRAATALLTDDEILTSLNIDQATLTANYSIVERARLKLKQQLNAKRISDAATNQGSAQALIEQIPRNNKLKNIQIKSQNGGAREGAGRPKGSLNKISGAAILASIEAKTGQSFNELLAEGYAESIQNNDRQMRQHYERLLAGKVIAEVHSIDVNDSVEMVEAKQAAFIAAISAIKGTAPNGNNG